MEDYTSPGYPEGEHTPGFTDGGKMPDPMLTLKSKTALEPSVISFDIYGDNYLKISPEGFFVEGRLVVEDREIYEAFKKWLTRAQEDLDKQDL